MEPKSIRLISSCRMLKISTVFALVLLSSLISCKVQQKSTIVTNGDSVDSFKTHSSGIQYRIIQQGRGNRAQANDNISVHYILKLEDGTEVDNSYERGEPASFKLGAGHVIKGWDEVMPLFRKGDKANLIIPPDMAYGNRGFDMIPANSTLYFEIEILNIELAPKPFDVKDNAEVVTTESGLRYFVHKSGRGTGLKPGMMVQIHYTGYFEDMKAFDSSFDRGEPIEFTLGKGMVIKGWEEALTLLKVGDHARLWIPYDLAYGEQGRGPIPPAANLIFDVEVVGAKEPVAPSNFDTSGRDTLETASGLKYIVVKHGLAEVPSAGQMVWVHYSGYLLNGEMFDSSVERGQPFRFVLGRGQVIKAWDEGVALMGKGAKYRFIIPPELGYGRRGVGPIPPNASLIFDVELLDFR